METVLEFSKYMESFYDFKGLWDSPSRCGLKIMKRKDGKVLVIVSEIYRQNPGTAITDCIDSLANQIIASFGLNPDEIILIEHSPDLKSRLSFYGETFDRVTFDREQDRFLNPAWTRLNREQVDALMEE